MALARCFSCLQFKNDEVVTKLDCSNTVFTDVFPQVWQYERTLEELHLTSTRINNLPPQLFYCQSLRILMANNNNLDSIPHAVGSLRHLQLLNLSRNFISSVPDSIKTCKHLTHLDLSCNNLQRLPDAITSLISLQELLLNETYLEFLPANFGRLINLRIVELRLNNLVTLPKSMARLTNLQRIDIGGNEFVKLPEVIGELKQLRELWIDFNQIRTVPPFVSKLRELQHLEANGNFIDLLPSEISNWRNIEVLSICANSLLSFPFSIGMLKTLVTFKCESNELCELPDSISNLENLEELVISHNKLIRLPATIGMMRKLRYLFADDNELRLLPDEICRCSYLCVLSVSRNKITELPQSIGRLNNLKVLNIVQNHISSLPVSLLSLVNLTSLWISDNQSQPVVPLQYLDTTTKTELTCFMLPQNEPKNGNYEFQHENPTSEKLNEAGGASSSLEQLREYESNIGNQQQCASHDYTESLSVTTPLLAVTQNLRNAKSEGVMARSSPSRRICFAEEATVLPSAPLVHSKNVSATLTNVPMKSKLSVAPSTSTQVPLSRDSLADVSSSKEFLMRSPTPYPKELRLMAKYVKNSQRQTYSTTKEKTDVEETKDMYNISDTQHEEGSRICKSWSHGTPANNIDQLEVLQNPYSNQQTHTMQLLENESAIYAANTNSLPSNTEVSAQRQSQQTQVYQSTASQYYRDNQNEQVFSRGCYSTPITNSIYAAINNKAGPKEYNGYYEQHREPLTGTSTMLPPHTLLLEPPPYHIARVLTKKTAEDLTNYEAMRTQYQQNNNKQLECNAPSEVFTNKNQYNHDCHVIFNNNIQLSDSQNNGSGNNETKNLSARKDDGDHTRDNNIISGMIVCTSNSGKSTGDNRQKRSPWLFGVHKNPTVKQITIKWENQIGFEIGEIPNKEGLYVISVEADSNAARLLCINDKLLEIDGYDFTNISLVEAQQVLLRSRPVMNVMLSRK